MPKMHELLAVFDDQKGQATKTRSDLISTFSTKSHLFRKKVVIFRPAQEGVAPVTEAQSDIQSTLSKELDWVSNFLAKSIDCGYQIDLGNTLAKADLIVEDQGLVHSTEPGKVEKTAALYIKDVPATFLLQLEKHLLAVKELAVAIPTLDPAQGFALDEKSGKGIWKAREVIKERTKKTKKVLVLAPPTDKHPAQVQPYDEDVPVGTVMEQEWSALTTPAIKSAVLANIDTLLQSVKKARSRANAIDLDPAGAKIGRQLLDYIFKPLA